MTSQTIKSTYASDVETAALLKDLAKSWQVSKSAAIRRAIYEAAQRAAPIAQEKLKALDELQSRLALDEPAARAWCQDIASERHASTRKRIG